AETHDVLRGSNQDHGSQSRVPGGDALARTDRILELRRHHDRRHRPSGRAAATRRADRRRLPARIRGSRRGVCIWRACEDFVMSLPEWLEPMAATLTEDRFSGPEWIFERKYDGIRLLAYKDGADVRLFSRNRLLRHEPAIARAIADLPVSNVVLDGESDWDGGGAYHVFDILWLEGRSVTALPLHERQTLLEYLPLRPPLRRVPALDGDSPWERAC